MTEMCICIKYENICFHRTKFKLLHSSANNSIHFLTEQFKMNTVYILCIRRKSKKSWKKNNIIIINKN